VDGATLEIEPLILTPGNKETKHQFLREVKEREVEAIGAADEVYILGGAFPSPIRTKSVLSAITWEDEPSRSSK